MRRQQRLASVGHLSGSDEGQVARDVLVFGCWVRFSASDNQSTPAPDLSMTEPDSYSPQDRTQERPVLQDLGLPRGPAATVLLHWRQTHRYRGG
jgi:hypothetical protein